jgi:glycosyltransferase involved in cell wall biosynthesis
MMSNRLRVLHVQHSLAPGGMENGVVNVACALPSDEFEIHVCCLECSGDFAARLPKPENVTELHKGDGFSLRTIWELLCLIRKLRPDVIHTHNLGALIYGVPATLFGRLCPILHGEHGVPDEGVDAVRRKKQRRWLYSVAKKVHTVSYSLRDYFLESGFSNKKIIALINGVDTERFCQGNLGESRKKLGIAEDVPVVVIVGRLIASKGHKVLFKAFEKLITEFPDAILLVVGDGGDAQESIREAARCCSVSDHIRLEGYQSDTVRYYQAADLLVAPSTIEGLSNVVLEAMACGLPSLLHDACGNREVIESNVDGVIADLSKPDDLARELIQLFRAPQKMRELGDRARQTVVQRFSMRRMAMAYADAYREVAK